ncbi:AAA family ATPase [Sorangium sp. So ce854]|uniref:AAA family ATPase n=1 Tax=Sorangium sp. So ce854 TaxID=3133322 RepID=UPI003F5EF8AE
MHFVPPIGISDFRDLREAGAGYVDKTAFISRVLAEPAQVLLFPRPRRFGKTLNLSALSYFLEKTTEDLSHLFHGLDVWSDPAARARFQQHPVLFVSFKDIKASSYDLTFRGVRGVLQAVFRRHRYLLEEAALKADEAREFERLLNAEAPEEECWRSLRNLSGYLARYHQQKVVILIDEYDTPIQAGFLHGFLDDVVQLFRNMFSAGLKDNTDLFKGVLTGVLRVSRESLFSGLNNLIVHSILGEQHAASFGFTEPEVAAITGADAQPERLDELRAWYDGYLFGGRVIYNPWSILNYIHTGKVMPYWVNTSSNDLIYDLLVRRGMGLSHDMERLLSGGAIEARIDEGLVLRDLDQRADAVWSFLLLAGYLKPSGLRVTMGVVEASLSVPNLEVMLAFKDVFQIWLSRGLTDRQHVEALVRSVLRGDAEQLEALLERLLVTMMSFQDAAGREPEKLYHGFILGLLVALEGRYEVRSNRESGFGRADVLVRPKQPGQPGAVLELKVPSRRRGETPEQALDAAARQIRERGYAAELRAAGASPVHEIAVAFDGKRVWARTLEA